jgi:hypothetical protein
VKLNLRAGTGKRKQVRTQKPRVLGAQGDHSETDASEFIVGTCWHGAYLP